MIEKNVNSLNKQSFFSDINPHSNLQGFDSNSSLQGCSTKHVVHISNGLLFPYIVHLSPTPLNRTPIYIHLKKMSNTDLHEQARQDTLGVLKNW